MSRQLRERSREEDRPDEPAPLLRGYVAPKGSWVFWYWVVHWLIGFAVLVLTIMTIAGWEGGHVVLVLVTILFWVVGGGGWLWWYRRRKRMAGIARFARRQGFAYRPTLDEEELSGLLPDLPLFKRGKQRWANNVMAGVVDGVSFVFMDFTFTVEINPMLAAAAGLAGIGVAGGEYPEFQTVVYFPDLPRRMPRFRLVAKRLKDKSVTRLLEKVEDLEIADDEAFADSYAVEGEPEETVRRVFSQRVQEYFGERPTWYVECAGRSLAVFRPATQCSAPNVPGRIELSVEMMRTLTRT